MAWAGPLEVKAGDRVVITEMEHHSNIVPWQLLTERKGAELRWFGLTDDGQLDLSNIDELITEHTKVVSLTWVSNMLGTINPVAEIARRAHEVGAVVVRRRLAGRAAAARSTCRPSTPTSSPSPATRSPVRPASACCGAARAARPAAAVPRWRRDDRDRHDGEVDVRRHPAQVRGRHPADRRGRRPRRRRRLPHRDRPGQHPPPRAGDHRLPARRAGHGRAASRVLGPLDPTQRGGAVSFEVDGVHPHDVAQTLDSRGHRRTRRAPLRQAGAQAVRRAELDPRLVVPLHDAGRDRRPDRGARTTPRTTSRWRDGPRHASTRRSSWTTTAARTTRACGSRSRPRCTTSTRPAATRSPCASTSTATTVDRRVVRRRGLLDQPGGGLGDDRPGHRPARRQGAARPTRRSSS